MAHEQIKISRKELYKEVWSTPMTKLSLKFGLSDQGLAKICKRNNIPLPGIGYWAKVKYGKPVKKIPLPNIKNNEEIIIAKKEGLQPKRKLSPSKIKAIKEKYFVSKTMRNPHPMIAEIKKSNLKESFKYKGLYFPMGEKAPDISVSREMMPRALRFMDSFIKAFESRGHKVEVVLKGKYHRRGACTAVLIKGEEIEISLREKLNRFKKEGKHSWDRYIFKPSGRLTFRIESYRCRRANWSDGIKRKLEDYLYNIMLEILRAAKKKKEHRIACKIAERIRQEEERIRQEQERLRQEEQQKIQFLEQQVLNWKKSGDIREYLKAIKTCIIDKHGGYDEKSEFDQWLKWASSYADRLDPLVRNS